MTSTTLQDALKAKVAEADSDEAASAVTFAPVQDSHLVRASEGAQVGGKTPPPTR